MGNERLLELGIPRRGFLKKAAVAGFVAPVVVSFGLDGVAEASARRPLLPGLNNHALTQLYPNQCYPNQIFGNQSIPGLGAEYLLSLISVYLTEGMAIGDIPVGAGSPILENALQAALSLASQNGHSQGRDGASAPALRVCSLISQIIVAANRLPANIYATTVVQLAQQAEAEAGCACTIT